MDPSIPMGYDLISDLPDEVKRHLVCHLDGWSVIQFCATSKNWRELIEDMVEREANPNFTGKRVPKVAFDRITIRGSRADPPYTITCMVQMSHEDKENVEFLRNFLHATPGLSVYAGPSRSMVMGRREAMVELNGGHVNTPYWLLPTSKTLAPISASQQSPGAPSDRQPRRRRRRTRNDKSDFVVMDSFHHRNRGLTDQGDYLRRRLRFVDCRQLVITNDAGVILGGQMGAALKDRLLGVKRLQLNLVYLDVYRKLFLPVFMGSHKAVESVSCVNPTTFSHPDFYIPAYLPHDFYENTPDQLHNSALTFLSSIKRGEGYGTLVLDYSDTPWMRRAYAEARDESGLWMERVLNLALTLSPPLLRLSYFGDDSSFIRQEAIIGYLTLWLASDEVIGEKIRGGCRRRLAQLEEGTAGPFVVRLKDVFNARFPVSNRPIFPAGDNFILHWPHKATILNVMMDTRPFDVPPHAPDDDPPMFDPGAPLPQQPQEQDMMERPHTSRVTYPHLGTAIHQRLLLPLDIVHHLQFSTSKVLDSAWSRPSRPVYCHYFTRLRLQRPDGKELALLLANYYP